MKKYSEDKEYVIFSVYGSLKSHSYNHRVLGNNPEFLGNFNTEPKYTLFDGPYPVVERDGNTSIQCELYKITDKESIYDVFSLEDCSGQIQHDKRNGYDFDKIDTPYGEAIIFVMDKGKSNRTTQIKSGKWR